MSFEQTNEEPTLLHWRSPGGPMRSGRRAHVVRGGLGELAAHARRCAESAGLAAVTWPFEGVSGTVWGVTPGGQGEIPAVTFGNAPRSRDGGDCGFGRPPHSSPQLREWSDRAAVTVPPRPPGLDRAIDLCRDGTVEKIVWSQRFELSVVARVERMLTNLIDCHGDHAACFAVPVPGGPLLVGASPELLVRRSRERPAVVETVALAGTCELDADEPDTDVLARLRRDAKLDAEHRFVVDDIVARFETLGLRARVAPARLRRLGRIAHLETPIEAVAVPMVSVIDLAVALHPTPAVCGTPRERARALIATLEGGLRGHYAAPIGLVDADGFGEIRVALRTFEVDGSGVSIRVGAGLTAASDPDAEWREILAKLRSVTAALEVDPMPAALARSWS